LAQNAAASAGAATPMGAAASALYAVYENAGNGPVDFSGIINMIRGNDS
jgi:3-hydroxyisobutyrate dehydrogenase